MRDDNGESVDDIMPLILEVAHKYLIKVCVMFSDNIRPGFILMSFFVQVAVHIEPYKERNEVNMFTNVKYIIER